MKAPFAALALVARLRSPRRRCRAGHPADAQRQWRGHRECRARHRHRHPRRAHRRPIRRAQRSTATMPRWTRSSSRCAANGSPTRTSRTNGFSIGPVYAQDPNPRPDGTDAAAEDRRLPGLQPGPRRHPRARQGRHRARQGGHRRRQPGGLDRFRHRRPQADRRQGDRRGDRRCDAQGRTDGGGGRRPAASASSTSASARAAACPRYDARGRCRPRRCRSWAASCRSRPTPRSPGRSRRNSCGT